MGLHGSVSGPARHPRWAPEHPYVATSLNNLALLYKTQGQYAKAEPEPL